MLRFNFPGKIKVKSYKKPKIDKKVENGVEIRYTLIGRPYYVDHNTKTTYWENRD